MTTYHFSCDFLTYIKFYFLHPFILAQLENDMHKTDQIFNRVIERKLFQRRHEAKFAYTVRRVIEEVGPYLLGAVVGLLIACFVVFA